MASLSHCTMSNSVDAACAVRTVGRTQSPAHLLPALGENCVDGPLGSGVAGDLLLAQHRFKLAHQVGRAHNLLAQPAQKLDRPRIDHGDIHDVVVGRVLHGQPPRAGEHGIEARVQLLPA